MSENSDIFARYLISAGILGKNSIFGDMINQLEEEEKRKKEEQKKCDALLPLQLLPADLSDQYKKKFRIDSTFQYPCYLTLNGKRLSDEYFCYKNEKESDVKTLNSERYIILKVLKEEKYSESVMKVCTNKNPWHLEAYDCVVECSTGKIHHMSDEKFLYSAIQLHNNVCVDAKSKTIKYLPQNLELKYVKNDYSSFMCEMIGKYMFIKEKYSSEHMYRLDTVTGEICDMLDELPSAKSFENFQDKALFEVNAY